MRFSYVLSIDDFFDGVVGKVEFLERRDAEKWNFQELDGVMTEVQLEGGRRGEGEREGGRERESEGGRE